MQFLTQDWHMQQRLNAQTDHAGFDRHDLDGGLHAGEQDFFVQARDKTSMCGILSWITMQATQ